MNWNNKSVLVTGADGFIGSHLTERLVDLGAKVRAFCWYSSNGSYGWLDGVSAEAKRSIEFVLGDVRDARQVESAAKGIDTVFHLAALISIPFSYQAPESFVDTNIKGTLNLLEAARRQGCRRLIHTSTSEVYGTPDELPIRETHPLRGQSPYSASKIAADKLCEAYFCSFDLPVVVLRPFNTYGPRQSPRAVIPTILFQLMSGRKEIRLGRLDTKRDLTYVSDTVDGFVRAAEAPGVEGRVIQLGTGSAVSIGELMAAACRVCRAEAEVVEDPARIRPAQSEVLVLQSDPSGAARWLGWTAAISLEEGLRRTAAWVQSNRDQFDAERYHV